jgi:hypothetical protein
MNFCLAKCNLKPRDRDCDLRDNETDIEHTMSCSMWWCDTIFLVWKYLFLFTSWLYFLKGYKLVTILFLICLGFGQKVYDFTNYYVFLIPQYLFKKGKTIYDSKMILKHDLYLQYIYTPSVLFDYFNNWSINQNIMIHWTVKVLVWKS